MKGDLSIRAFRLYDTAMLLLDTVGLGIFTVTGITAAMRSGVSDNAFLLVFSGVITGVGGGVLRDICEQYLCLCFCHRCSSVFDDLRPDVIYAVLHHKSCNNIFSAACICEIWLESAENTNQKQVGARIANVKGNSINSKRSVDYEKVYYYHQP